MGGDFERRPLDTVETIGQEDVFHRRSLLIPKAFRRHHKRNRSGRHRMRARAREGVGNTRAQTVRSNPRGADRWGARRARPTTDKAAPARSAWPRAGQAGGRTETTRWAADY